MIFEYTIKVEAHTKNGEDTQYRSELQRHHEDIEMAIKANLAAVEQMFEQLAPYYETEISV